MSLFTARQSQVGFFSQMFDRRYLKWLFQIALPITLQNLIMALLSMVAAMMIGQVGDTAVAAVGLANQIYFLLNLYLFGTTSGAAMFTAQLWGNQDIPNIRKVLGLCLLLCLAGSAVFLAVSQFAPQVAIQFYSNDPAVVELGSRYLQIMGWSFLFFGVTYAYSAVLRSTGDVTTPLLVSVTALLCNAVLSYILIFGKFGFPRLEAMGAAVSILISRVLECLTLVTISYRKRSPVAARWKELIDFDIHFIGRILRPVIPVTINEILWSLGITTYYSIYAHIGTAAVAAMNIVATLDTLAMVPFNGIGVATSILVGNAIGAKQEREAYRQGARALFWGALGGIGMGMLIAASSNLFLSVYKVSPTVILDARRLFICFSLFYWLRSCNVMLFIGIFRSGGDTRYALLLDGIIIWILGVPLVYLGGIIWHLPIYWVYLLTMSEEFSKWALGIARFTSKKWIHHLAARIAS